MKIKFLSIFILITIISNAQVGIGTTNPKSTLDITGKPSDSSITDGLLIPRLTGEQLKAKDNLYSLDNLGTIVFVTTGINTDSTTPKTINVTTRGYYYFDGNIWLQLGQGSNKEQFYAPSIILPTSIVGVSTSPADDIYYTDSNKTYTVKLFNIYNKQFSMTGDITGANRTAIKSNSSSTLKTYTNTELDYFITYFDNLVFDPQSITLDANGVLTYKIVDTPFVSEKTYMNIVFKVK